MNGTFEIELYRRAFREGWRPRFALSPRPNLIRQIILLIAGLFGAVFIGTMLFVIIPLTLFAPVSLLMLVAPNTHAAIAKGQFSVEFCLALQTVLVAGAAFGFGASGYRLFCPKAPLAVLPFFPTRDREVLRWAKAPWKLTLGYFSFSWLWAASVLAWNQGFSIWQFTGLLALGAVQTCHIAALVVAIAHWLPPDRRKATDLLAGGLIAFAFLYVVVLLYVPHLTLPATAAKAILITPFGWIHGAMTYGLIEGSPLGWAYLAPAAILWAHAYWLLKRGFGIRELRTASTGETTPIFEYGFPNAKEQTKAAAEKSSAARLEDSSSLAPADWSGGWFVERSIGKRIPARDKALLELLYGGRPRWTLVVAIEAAVAMICFGCGAFVLAIGGAHALPQNAFALFSLPLIFVLPCAEFAVAACGMLSPLYPCGLKEMLAAHRKPFLWRMGIFAPLLLAVAGIEHWHREDGWRHVGGVLFIAAIFAAAIFPLMARLPFFFSVRRKGSTRRNLLPIAELLAFGMLNVFVIVPMSWYVSLLAAVSLFALARHKCWRLDRAYAVGEVDFCMNSPTRSRRIRNNP